jgi:hypothetical protein
MMALATCSAAVVAAAVFGVAPAHAASPCGFYPITTGSLGGGDDGHYEKGTYNNCKAKNATITVRYTYTSQQMCVTPGETTLYANPDLGALTGATWTGKYC